MAKRKNGMRKAPLVISSVAILGFAGAVMLALRPAAKPAEPVRHVAALPQPAPVVAAITPPLPSPVVAVPSPVAVSPAASAPAAPLRRMTSAEWRVLDAALAETLKRCWSASAKASASYVPKIKVAFAPNGAIQGKPVLLNPAPDADAKKVASGAIDALSRCASLPIPAALQPHYAEWQTRIVRFTPAGYDPNQAGG